MTLPPLRSLLPAVLSFLVLTSPAFAVIKKLTPLKEVLDGEQFIFIAKVDKVDPDKPSVVFAVGESLKGKAPVERLAVNLTGDSFAKKDDHTKVMLDRLADGREVVFFASKQGTGYSCFGYLEGTWFQLKGTTDADGKTVRWAFLHCEPYFTRTFKGSTADLKTTVTECLAGKRKPPEPDEKAEPGYGPPVKKCGTGNAECGIEESAAPLDYRSFHSALRTSTSAFFGVIPSFVLIGPLALIAAFFPGVFARMAVGMKRWRAFLVVASTNSTLALTYFGLRELGWLPDAKWASPTAFGFLILAVTAGGLFWAGYRYRRMAATEPDVTAPPPKGELLALASLTAALGLLVCGTAWLAGWGEALFPAGFDGGLGQAASGIGKEFTAIAIGLGIATVYALYRAVTRSLDEANGAPPPVRMSLSGEAVGLAAMFVFGCAMMVTAWPRDKAALNLGGEIGDASTEAGDTMPKLADVKVWFETADAHDVMSAITVEKDRVVFGAAKMTGFRQSGFVYCVDRVTGQKVWTFTNDDDLKPVFATPAVVNGKVFAGEGLHTDVERRVFCLGLADMKPQWPAPAMTTSHTEGSPRVVNGKVYFSAGDDGVYCVNESDGKAVWHMPGSEQKLHVDTPPAVAGNRVFAGSGYNTLAIFALDAEKGTELWRVPTKLRSFGPPLVLGNNVVYGLGTGNLSEDLSQEPEKDVPRETKAGGALLCVTADGGKEVWRYDFPKSVHTNLAADARTIYAACRDGYLYALDRKTGKMRWKQSLGTALTSGPAVVSFAGGTATVAVYAVSNEGIVACLDPATGKPSWIRDMRAHTGRDVQVVSTPAVVSEGDGARRSLYFGAMLTNRNNGTKSAAVFRIEDVIGE